MEDFFKFLDFSKNSLNSSQNIHLVLGNESCDLDSTISALLFAYYFFKRKRCQIPTVPILNVSKENFLLRTENCFVLKDAGIDLNRLVYRDEINFDSLLKRSNVTVTLVDHHILSQNDKILSNKVIQILDHRPVDTSHDWDRTKVNICIEQVGSCATLVTDEIWKGQKDILTKPLAYLLYETIIYDTIALIRENGKATDLDIEIGTTLELEFEFDEPRKSLFDKLWAAHNDVSHLTPKQLLYKDLKVVEGIYVPGLPMLVEDFLKLDKGFESLETFANDHNVNCIVLVGLNAKNSTVRRDTAIFSNSKEDSLKDVLLKVFKNSLDYDFKFEQRATKFKDIVLLHVHNVKLSRKQLVPLVKEAVLLTKQKKTT